MEMTATKSILLVEDNPYDQKLAMRALSKSKIANEVTIARDGVEALHLLHGAAEGPLPDLPQVMLLDLKLPKVAGLEVLQAVRAHPRTRFLPVVVMTSSDEERDLVESYQLGANSYIRKPVDFAQFVEAIGQLGLYWLVLNQVPGCDAAGHLGGSAGSTDSPSGGPRCG